MTLTEEQIRELKSKAQSANGHWSRRKRLFLAIMSHLFGAALVLWGFIAMFFNFWIGLAATVIGFGMIFIYHYEAYGRK